MEVAQELRSSRHLKMHTNLLEKVEAAVEFAVARKTFVREATLALAAVDTAVVPRPVEDI